MKRKNEQKKTSLQTKHSSRQEKKRSKLKRYKFVNFKTKVLEKFFPKKTLLVEMNNYNGTISHFVLKIAQHKFNYNQNTYLIDEERKLWNTNAKMFMLRYHEGFSLPFEVEVSSNKLQKHGTNSYPEIATSFNPSVLKEVLKMEYARGVIQGAEVHKFLKNVFLLVIITLCLAAGHLALDAFMSGWI